MSIALSPTPAHVTKTWVALAGTLLVVALMWVVKEEINPDWYGYAAIYSDDGAWLADQGRDPLFVMLLGAMAAMTGPDEYMTFRIVVGLYFATFTYLLLKGRILPLGPKPHSNLLLFIGILPFIAPRFTIQIREGIAVTVALFGMALVASRGRGSQDANRTTLSAMGALLLFVASYATHSGAIVLPLALLVSWTIQRRTKSSLGRELQVLVLM